MCAKVTLGQADGFHNAFQSVEFQRIDAYMFAQHLHEVGVFLAGRVAILFDVAAVVALHFLDAAARDEFHHIFRGREIEEGAAVEQWRATDAHMHLAGTEVIKHLHIVAQLRAAHDGVVAKSHLLAVQKGAVGDEFHLGHMLPLALVDGHEAP